MSIVKKNTKSTKKNKSVNKKDNNKFIGLLKNKMFIVYIILLL